MMSTKENNSPWPPMWGMENGQKHDTQTHTLCTNTHTGYRFLFDDCQDVVVSIEPNEDYHGLYDGGDDGWSGEVDCGGGGDIVGGYRPGDEVVQSNQIPGVASEEPIEADWQSQEPLLPTDTSDTMSRGSTEQSDGLGGSDLLDRQVECREVQLKECRVELEPVAWHKVHLTECRVELEALDLAQIGESNGESVLLESSGGNFFVCGRCRHPSSSRFESVLHSLKSDRCAGYTSPCQFCNTLFRGKRGVATHVAKSTCKEVFEASKANESDHCMSHSKPGSLTGLETHHSTLSRHDSDSEAKELSNMRQREPIDWPGMKESERWESFNNAVHKQLCDAFNVYKRLRQLDLIIYEQAVEMFGTKVIGSGVRRTSRRQAQIRNVRRQCRDFGRAMRDAEGEDEKAGISLLLEEAKERRRVLVRVESGRKRRWRRKRMRSSFCKDPYGAGKDLLKPRVRGYPKVSLEALDEYVLGVASDDRCDQPLGDLQGLVECKEAEHKFKDDRFSFDDLAGAVKRKRNSSRPGPNQIPYKVYKKCPDLLGYLFDIMKSFASSGKVPLQWRVSDGIFIPKVPKPDQDSISDYRQIALMNVEGKLWWSMVSQRFYDYLVTNNSFIDVSVQKGSIQNMSGCWEHTSMMWEALQDARKRNRSVAVLWLDLANAYGSVPHSLIIFALKRYSVPDRWINLIVQYYGGLWGRSWAGKVASNWHQYMRGIFAGCTISVILFLAAFNVILEYVSQVRGSQYILGNGNRLPMLRGFMDDVSVMCRSVPAAQLVLERTRNVLDWARMSLKPSKSRCVVIVKGRVVNSEPFTVNEEKIPSIHNKPLKTLGRFFDGSLSDRKAISELEEKLISGIKVIDRSLFTGSMKLWIMHHLLLPQIRWQIMIYEITSSKVAQLEPVVSRYARKWLGVSSSMSTVALYCKEVPCPLPLTSLTSLFKSTKVNALLQLKYSSDVHVHGNVTDLRTGIKWTPAKAVGEAESRIRLEKLCGSPQTSRAGVGASTSAVVPNEGTGAYRKYVVKTVTKQEDEVLFTKAIQQGVQGRWTTWQSFMKRDLRWKKLLSLSPRLVSFALGVTYDTLASPTNLKRWGLLDSSTCSLCSKEGCNISHVLSGCKIGLSQGRFRYRHDAVLRGLADVLSRAIGEQSTKSVCVARKLIVFVKEGSKPVKSSSKAPGILHGANDWVLSVDLDRRLVFPQDIVETDQRPDVVILSKATSKLVILELTCPSEENFEERHLGKLVKYEELQTEARRKGWEVHLFAVEVGARGYASCTLRTCLMALGLSPKMTRSTLDRCGDIALRCSFWIWVQRDNVAWRCGWAGQYLKVGESLSGCVLQSNQIPDVVSKEPTNADLQPQEPLLPTDTSDTMSRGSTERSNGLGGYDPLQKQAERRESVRFPVGLRNIGNTCYMNAALQCLFLYTARFESRGGGPVMSAFRSLSESVLSHRSCVTPSLFWKRFTADAPSFQVRQPHDADEFLDSFFSVTGRSLTPVFEGEITEVLRCVECANESSTTEIFTRIHLPFASNLSIVDGLTNFGAFEIVEDAVCSQCGGSSLSTESRISVAPGVLIVVLNRFCNVGGVVSKDDSSVVPSQRVDILDDSYQLEAVVLHEGSRHSGHYTSVVLHGSRWRLYNDGVSSRLYNQRTLTSAGKLGYIFFYRKL